MLTLPLILVENGKETADLSSTELKLDFFRAQELDLNLCGFGRRLLLVAQTLYLCLVEHLHGV